MAVSGVNIEFSSLKIINIATGTEVVYDAVDYDAVILNYNGGDDKYGTMVPSELQFSLIDKSATDNRYKFITDNINEYMVELAVVDNSGVTSSAFTLWRGFLVSSEYAEPITGINAVVQFTAIDGLATLTEKYLSNYNRHVTVFALLQELINLTGLIYPLQISPAIINNNKAWADIEINLQKYDGQNAYDILNEILTAMMLQVYFEKDIWHFEGWNVRQSIATAVFNIDTAGAITTSTRTLTKRVSKYAPDPMVRINYPLKNIKVTALQTDRDIKDLSNYKDYPYAYSNQRIKIMSPTWWGHNVQIYQYNDENYKIVANTAGVIDESRYAFYNFYVEKGAKIKITGKLSSVIGVTIDADDLRYKFKVNDKVVQANYTTSEGYEPLYFDTEQTIHFRTDKATMLYDFVAYKNGYFQLYIMVADKITIDDFDIEVTDPAQEVLVENNPLGYDNETELAIYPDVRNISKSFILADVHTHDEHVNVNANIYYKRIVDGQNYLFVNAIDANYILQYIDRVTWNGASVNIKDVVFNYLGGESIAVVVDDLTIDNTYPLVVDTVSPSNVLSARDEYYNWYDNYYGIGHFAYLDIYADILKRLRKNEFKIIDTVMYDVILMTDLLYVRYDGVRKYRATNISINLLAKQSTVLLHELAYNVDSITAHPPYVITQTPVILPEADDTTTIVAEIVDVDSAVSSVNWSELIGSGSVITTPNDAITDVENLTDDYYKYQIDVFDPINITSGIIEVIRQKTHGFVLEFQSHDDSEYCVEYWVYKLVVSPGMPDNMIMLIDIRVSVDFGGLRVKKNGVEILNPNDSYIPNILRVSYTKYDEIMVYFDHFAYENGDDCDWNSSFAPEFEIQRVDVINGVGLLSGIPYLFEEIDLTPQPIR